MNDLPQPTKPAGGYSPISSVQTELREEMYFSDALKAMLLGNKVTRIAWDNENSFGFVDPKTDILMIVNKGTHAWMVHRLDIEAEDWVVVR